MSFTTPPSGKGRAWLANLLPLLLSFVTALSSQASLVIVLHHNEALYIASDSAMTSAETGKRQGSARKTFRIAENCLVAITGAGKYEIDRASGEEFASLDFTKILGELSGLQLTNAAPLDKKMENVAMGLRLAYGALRTNGWVKLSTTGGPGPTSLLFAGYSPVKSFFIDECILDGNNDVQVKCVKKFTGTFDTNQICIQGQPAFLNALLSGEKPELLELIPEEFTQIATQLNSDEKVPDDRIIRFILEMFRLHEKYAYRYGFDKYEASVGPPYSIFKVLKHDVVDLTPASQSEPPKSSASASQADPADDEAIDRSMAILESTMKANDYSYVFEVMYAPMLAKLGGKDQAALAVQALSAQMKEQQVVMLSWKAKKPYQYIRGSSRSYAIISYEGVMTIAGKKIRQKSYQLGIKVARSRWQFVNGDSLQPEVFREYFPDFPRSVNLPKLERNLE